MFSTHARRWILGGAAAVLALTGGGVALANPWAAAAPAAVIAPAAPAAPAPAPAAPAPQAAPHTAPKSAPKTTRQTAPKPAPAAVMAQYKGIVTGDLVRTCHAKTGRSIVTCNAEVRDGINQGLIIGPRVALKTAPKAAPKTLSPGEYALQICMKQNHWTRAQCQADAAAGNAN